MQTGILEDYWHRYADAMLHLLLTIRHSPDAAILDDDSVQDWIDRNGATREAREVYAGAVRSVTAAEPKEVSMLYWMWIVRCGEHVLRVTSTEQGGQERKFLGGSQQISDRLAKGLKEGTVRLRHAVRAVVTEKDGVTVHCHNGAVLSAKCVV